MAADEENMLRGATRALGVSQWNLAIAAADGDEAGPPAVALTFEIDPTWDTRTAMMRRRELEQQGERSEAALEPQVEAAARMAELVLNSVEPDELLFDWGGLPPEASAQLYVPGLDAADIFELMSRRREDRGCAILDEHTLVLPVGGRSRVPIPAVRPGTLAALLTLEVPEAVNEGQTFTVAVRQVSGRPARVVRTFELRIPVTADTSLFEAGSRRLQVLEDRLQARPADHRWTPVLRRLLLVAAGRTARGAAVYGRRAV